MKTLKSKKPATASRRSCNFLVESGFTDRAGIHSVSRAGWAAAVDEAMQQPWASLTMGCGRGTPITIGMWDKKQGGWTLDREALGSDWSGDTAPLAGVRKRRRTTKRKRSR